MALSSSSPSASARFFASLIPLLVLSRRSFCALRCLTALQSVSAVLRLSTASSCISIFFFLSSPPEGLHGLNPLHRSLWRLWREPLWECNSRGAKAEGAVAGRCGCSFVCSCDCCCVGGLTGEFACVVLPFSSLRDAAAAAREDFTSALTALRARHGRRLFQLRSEGPKERNRNGSATI